MKLATTILVFLLLSGCMAPGTKLPDNFIMQPDHGIVFFRSQCARTLGVRLQETGSDAGGYFAAFTSTKTVFCEPELALHALSLKAGSYYFNQVTDGSSYPDFPESESLVFSVEPSTTTYAGDFSVDSSNVVVRKDGSKTNFLEFKFEDNEKLALEEFDLLYPGMRDQYGYRKQLFLQSQ